MHVTFDRDNWISKFGIKITDVGNTVINCFPESALIEPLSLVTCRFAVDCCSVDNAESFTDSNLFGCEYGRHGCFILVELYLLLVIASFENLKEGECVSMLGILLGSQSCKMN